MEEDYGVKRLELVALSRQIWADNKRKRPFPKALNRAMSRSMLLGINAHLVKRGKRALQMPNCWTTH